MRSRSRQNRHSTGAPASAFLRAPQHDVTAPFRGSAKAPRATRTCVPYPAPRPMTTAATALNRVNGRPNTAAIRMNICGSISGEAIQNAMTGASGTPAASRPAMIGTTPQEQKGETAPNNAARKIAVIGRLVNARAIWRSRPVALVQAAASTDIRKKGAIKP